MCRDAKSCVSLRKKIGLPPNKASITVRPSGANRFVIYQSNENKSARLLLISMIITNFATLTSKNTNHNLRS